MRTRMYGGVTGKAGDGLPMSIEKRNLLMHIYIDESGIFRNPANKANVASVVAALAVPTSKKKELFKQFRTLTHEWRDENGEVKGSNLNEAEIALVIFLLRKFDVIL